MLVIIVAALSVALFTCSANSERSLRSVVTSDLDAIKHIEPAALDMLKDQLAKGEQFGIDSREFASVWLEGFSYSLGDLSVEGDRATVEVSFTVKSLQASLDSSMPDIAKIMEEVSETDSIEDAYAQCGKIILKNLRSGQLSAGTITLSYHFDGKTWVMDSKSAKELALALSSPT